MGIGEGGVCYCIGVRVDEYALGGLVYAYGGRDPRGDGVVSGEGKERGSLLGCSLDSSSVDDRCSGRNRDSSGDGKDGDGNDQFN